MDEKNYSQNQTNWLEKLTGSPDVFGSPQKIAEPFLQAGQGLIEGENVTGFGISPIDALLFAGPGFVTKLGKGVKLVQGAEKAEKGLKIGQKGFDISRNAHNAIKDAGLGEELAKKAAAQAGAIEKEYKALYKSWTPVEQSKALDKAIREAAGKKLSPSKAGRLAYDSVKKAGLEPQFDTITKNAKSGSGFLTKMTDKLTGKIGKKVENKFVNFLLYYGAFRWAEAIIIGLVTDKQASAATEAGWYASGLYDTDENGNPISPEQALVDFESDLDKHDLGDQKQFYVKTAIEGRRLKEEDDLKKSIAAEEQETLIQRANQAGFRQLPGESQASRANQFLGQEQAQVTEAAGAQENFANEEMARQALFNKYGVQGFDVGKFIFENPNLPEVQAYIAARAMGTRSQQQGFTIPSTAKGSSEPFQTTEKVSSEQTFTPANQDVQATLFSQKQIQDQLDKQRKKK